MKRTIIITGATDGIGKQTALELAKQGFNLGLVGRNPEKGASVVSELIRETGNESIQFHYADLSIMESVQKLADEIQSSYETIDVLLNNAGAYFSKLNMTDEGFEKTFALNHLAYFYLTTLLLEMVKNGNPGRIINVASTAHKNTELDFEDIQGMNDYKGWPAYGRSKLMNIMFTYECHRRLGDTGVTFNCLHPGFVNSCFGNNNSGFARGSINLGKSIFAINVMRGAKTSVFLASADEVEGISGKYFDKCKAKKSSKVSYIEEDQKQLWETTEDMIKSIQIN
jgi:NAD(P)-dependent dehydrogenase (short-subunit alcohol dehydrogenase family)